MSGRADDRTRHRPRLSDTLAFMPPDLMLAIETSNPRHLSSDSLVGVAIAGPDGQIHGVRELAPRSRHDDALLPAIHDLCAEIGVEGRDLGRIAVSIGPGGYTSIRIAATTAKLMAEASGASCIGVPTASAALMVLPEELRRRPVTVCLAWKRADVWCAEFGADWRGEEVKAGIVPLDELAPPDGGVLVGDEQFRSMMLEQGTMRDDQMHPLRLHPAGVVDASEWYEPVEPERLLPLYPREPEAVSKWAALKTREGRS